MSILNKNTLIEIICKRNTLLREDAIIIANEILETLYGKLKPAEEVPILVGHLNKQFGFNGAKPILIGSEVYEFAGNYFFEMELNNGQKQKVKYYKETLKPCINFLIN